MPEESYSFAKARVRLDEIVTQVRKKDTSLEKSLDLLEEGVRLANQCTELIDHADWEAADATSPSGAEAASGDGEGAEAGTSEGPEAGSEAGEGAEMQPVDDQEHEESASAS